MDAVIGNQAKGFFNKMVEELKTFKLSIFGKYICMLAAIMMVFSAFGAKSFLMCIINLCVALLAFALEYLGCFICFKEIKPINEKLDALRTPLYKGCIFLVGGILFWQSSFIVSIIAILGGLFLVLGNFVDKKDSSKAPMV